jgi:RNA polymerase sigma-70 factor (ECF subfamily)
MDESAQARALVSSVGQPSASREGLPAGSGRELAWREYLARAAKGDEGALAAFYDETCTLVHGLAYRVLGDLANAEEVTLDVYVQVWKGAASFDVARGSIVAWLAMLTRSRAIDRLRQAAARGRREESLDESRQIRAAISSPEQEVSLREERMRVRVALGTLPAEQRQVIEMGYFGSFSHGEIAGKLGLPLGTVKTRARLGMIKLREALA